MGGEFYFVVKPNNVIDEEQWHLALEEIMEEIIHDDRDIECDEDYKISFNRPNDEYAFVFVDSCASWSHGEPKSFKLKWKWGFWGADAIESHLGGRHRGDWSVVRRLCEKLCLKFPEEFALVISDGFSGGDDDAGVIYFDGTNGYKKIQDGEFNMWPWRES